MTSVKHVQRNGYFGMLTSVELTEINDNVNNLSHNNKDTLHRLNNNL
jgi:CRISPR/Cas system-associated endoribonuclease Cas2